MDPLLHRWSDLPTDHPMPLLDRRRIIGTKMMISQVFLHKGCDVPTHAHENEQFAVVISGRVRFGLGAEGSRERRDVIAEGGDVVHLPSNLPHSAYALEDTQILDLFAPPSATTGVDIHGRRG